MVQSYVDKGLRLRQLNKGDAESFRSNTAYLRRHNLPDFENFLLRYPLDNVKTNQSKTILVFSYQGLTFLIRPEGYGYFDFQMVEYVAVESSSECAIALAIGGSKEERYRFRCERDPFVEHESEIRAKFDTALRAFLKK